jgi:hypothetical protein
MSRHQVTMVLQPEDECPHEPDAAANYNESMYLNGFDLEREVGGWFRLGNRVNEGYAEMTVCLYLPGGRVAFMYQRPRITTNEAMDAGGLRIEVVRPFEELRISYAGTVCVLDDPLQMADPRRAFRENPHVDCTIDVNVAGMSPMYGGRPVRDDGTEDRPRGRDRPRAGLRQGPLRTAHDRARHLRRRRRTPHHRWLRPA